MSLDSVASTETKKEQYDREELEIRREIAMSHPTGKFLTYAGFILFIVCLIITFFDLSLYPSVFFSLIVLGLGEILMVLQKIRVDIEKNAS